MKSPFLFVFVGLLWLNGLQGAANFNNLQVKAAEAQGPEDKAKAYYELAEAYSSAGDHARALNQLEKVQPFIFKVQSSELVNRIESLYWKSFREFNVINPRQALYDARQEKIEEKKRVAKEKAENQKNKEENRRMKNEEKPFLSSTVEEYRKALRRGRPRFRRRLSPLSMGHMNGLNTVVGVPELDSAYLLPVQANWSLDYRFDLGFYEENSTDGFSRLQVDTSITRGLFELTLPYKTFRNWRFRRRNFASESRANLAFDNRPFDLKIGIPVVRWSTKPYFIYDITSPATSTLMDGGSGSYALGDLFIEMKTAFVSTPHSAFGMKLRLKAPTGSAEEIAGTGSLDIAGAMLYSSSLGSNHINLNLGYVMTGDSKNFQGVSVDLSDIIFFGGDFALNLIHHHYLLFSLDYHQNAFRDYTNIPVFEDPPMSVGIGYATQLFNDRLYFGLKSGMNGASADQSFMITYRRLR